ncbi:hypothetical protein cyc_03816 [Cyclospora cayetanensis]|uniref:Uncharacterized protein n=1 Tax=Cyclospora cayetanensis TaxID=88456 RepID=A0A1D3CW78_9EIME|nr:hypothetical protein cyc_03816 [Cyclospora cayetanensis]
MTTSCQQDRHLLVADALRSLDAPEHPIALAKTLASWPKPQEEIKRHLNDLSKSKVDGPTSAFGHKQVLMQKEEGRWELNASLQVQRHPNTAFNEATKKRWTAVYMNDVLAFGFQEHLLHDRCSSLHLPQKGQPMTWTEEAEAAAKAPIDLL